MSAQTEGSQVESAAKKCGLLTAHQPHLTRPRLERPILLHPRSASITCVSTSEGGRGVKTAAAAASASTSDSGAAVKNVAEAASASTSDGGAGVKNVAEAASVSTSE